ncbi:MAG: YggT family protein [Gammaproteobacteria bacterium]
MSNSFPELGYFVIDLIISFLILVFTLRLLLAMSSANGNNPITQTIIKISRPIRSFFVFLPNIGKFELSSFIIIFLCHFINMYMHTSIIGSDVLLEKLLLFSLKSSIFSILNALTIIFIILAISSWFTQSINHNRNPALDIIYEISNPILYSIKRIVPTSVGVIDFSVIIALVLIHFIQNFINIILKF